jgi:hypothetical protein
MRLKQRLALSFVVASAALAAAPAMAQEAPLSKVYACADIADSTQRLACYDGAVATLKQADAGGDIAVVSRQQVQKVEKDAFGLAVPSVSELAASAAPAAAGKAPAAAKPPKAEKPKPLDRVTLQVKAINRDRQGGVTFVMENGQIWKKIDTTSMIGIGKGPWTAEIRKASLGSYILSLSGTTASARVKRIE